MIWIGVVVLAVCVIIALVMAFTDNQPAPRTAATLQIPPMQPGSDHPLSDEDFIGPN